jgi:hypothetical protein
VKLLCETLWLKGNAEFFYYTKRGKFEKIIDMTKIVLEVPENKTKLALEFFKNVSFIKKANQIAKNEITNSLILAEIEAYEKGFKKPSKIDLAKLKKMLHA